MGSWLFDWDVSVFRAINGLSGGYGDTVMLLLTSRFFWIVAGVGFLVFALAKRSKRLLLGCLFILMTNGFSDAVTFHVLKPTFQRERPCYALDDVNLVQSRCGSTVGFPSNHAANGMATAMAATLYFGFRYGVYFFALAALVGFTRIYLGVHYPLDILAGFGVGIGYALLMWFVVWRPLRPRMDRALNRFPSLR